MWYPAYNLLALLTFYYFYYYYDYIIMDYYYCDIISHASVTCISKLKYWFRFSFQLLSQSPRMPIITTKSPIPYVWILDPRYRCKNPNKLCNNTTKSIFQVRVQVLVSAPRAQRVRRICMMPSSHVLSSGSSNSPVKDTIWVSLWINKYTICQSLFYTFMKILAQKYNTHL